MFGKDKNAILTTNLIVKVRKYENTEPYFSLYTVPAIADETKARESVEKLNSLAELEKKRWLARRILFCQHDFIMLKDLTFIILGVASCYAYYSWQDYKRKQKEKQQERLNRIK